MRRVLVTGSRDLKTPWPVYEALRAQVRISGGVDKLTIIEGRCPYDCMKRAKAALIPVIFG